MYCNIRNRDISKFIQKITENFKKALTYVGIFSFFINALMLVLPIYMLQIFDRVLSSFSSDTLIYLTLITVFLLLIFALLSAVRSHLLVHLSSWMDQYVSPVALSRTMDELLRGNPYASRSAADILTLRQFLNSPAVTTLFDAPWVPIYLIVIFFLNVWLGVIATIGAIALFLCGWLNERLTS